jgi:hypothetical protein
VDNSPLAAGRSQAVVATSDSSEDALSWLVLV